MLAKYPQEKKLNLKDRSVVEQYLKKYSGQRINDHNFVTLFIWQNRCAPRLSLLNKNLLIYWAPEKNSPQAFSPLFQAPLGEQQLEQTLLTCLQKAKIGFVDQEFIAKLDKNFLKTIKLKELTAHSDYVYSISRLARLSGKKFDGKRNKIKKFEKNYPDYTLRSFRFNDKKQALQLFQLWAENKSFSSIESPKRSLDSQEKALKLALDYYRQLRLFGKAIVIEGKIKAFILASKQNRETINAHFLYFERRLDGISQTLLQQFCQSLTNKFSLLNLEQDMGIAGIKKYKQSYQPLRIEKKYELRSK